MESSHTALQQCLDLDGRGLGKVLELGDQTRQILGFGGRPQGDPEMTTKLQRSAEGIALDNVRSNRDGGATKLIEQGSGSWVVIRITLLQREDGDCLSALPGDERPILVHKGKLVVRRSTHRID